MAVFKGKDKNPFDELVSFCQSNKLDSNQEVRLRGIIDRIHKFKSELQNCTSLKGQELEYKPKNGA